MALLSEVYPPTYIPCRSFAKRNRKSFQTKKNKRKTAKAAPGAPPTPNVTLPPTKQIIPPAFLFPTASPYVYVSKIVVDDEEDGQDPRQLFSDIVQQQGKPRSSRYVYRLEPSDFGGAAHPAEKLDHIPRIAVLGRSNVGKSSLLNALFRQPLALTSKQPGRTQKVHYYGYYGSTQPTADQLFHQKASSAQAFLLDLPGYGYAVGPDQQVEEWQRRTQQLILRSNIQRVYMLTDARLEPQSVDATVQGWLDQAGVPYVVVLTKADAVRKALLVKHVNHVCGRYTHLLQEALQTDDDSDDEPLNVFQSPLVHVTSAKEGAGLDELWYSIETDIFHS